jgi:glutaredoxin
MEGQSRLTVNIGDIDDQIRPRANSESSAKKPELAKKKSEQFQLPQIFVEEVDDFDHVCVTFLRPHPSEGVFQV